MVLTMHPGTATMALPRLLHVGLPYNVQGEVALVGLVEHPTQMENMVGQVIIIINGNVINA